MVIHKVELDQEDAKVYTYDQLLNGMWYTWGTRSVPCLYLGKKLLELSPSGTIEHEVSGIFHDEEFLKVEDIHIVWGCP